MTYEVRQAISGDRWLIVVVDATGAERPFRNARGHIVFFESEISAFEVADAMRVAVER